MPSFNDDTQTPLSQPITSGMLTRTAEADYVPTPDVAPPQAPIQATLTTSRTAFSARTMSEITSSTRRQRGRPIPTVRMVAKLALLMDVSALGFLALCTHFFSFLFSSSWSAPFPGSVSLFFVLLGTLALIDAHRIELRERFWRSQAQILGSLGLAAALVLGGAYAAGWWKPVGLDAFLRDELLFITVGFALLATLNRILLYLWLGATVSRASWLLVARRDTDGLAQFWSDFNARLTHGQLMFLADEPGSREISRRDSRASSGQTKPPVGGQWQDLKAQLMKGWSGIIVADASQLDAETVRAVMAARLAGIPALSLEEFYEHYWHRVPVFLLRSEWFALSRGFDLLRSPVQSGLKRVGDMLLAGGLLLLAAPVMLVIIACIKIDSPGPILYRQARTGRGGKVFTCLKFRSMINNADRGPLYAAKGDQRVTSFGRFIRRARIDELPQLINVLKGDMSFIGPRAMWTKIVDEHDKEIPYFQLRHLVRPGLTGWAQVNYHYGGSAEDMRIKLEYDLWYIKNQSVVLDLWIVLRTVRVVLFGIGAQ